MKKSLFLLFALTLVAGCTTTLTESTSTPLPPTKPPLPTDTMIPLTQGPNPDAEEILLGFAEAINDKNIEAVQESFTEDAIAKLTINEVEGQYAALYWVQLEIEKYESLFKISDFVIEGNNVTFTWFIDSNLGHHRCTGKATLHDDKISSIEMFDCDK